MRIVVFVLTALAILPAPASAQEHIEYPWCANYSGGASGGGGSNCGFTSFEQCQETVRGMGGFCDPNPFYHRPPPSPARRQQKRSNG